jgi:hypothetical protein
MSDKNILGAAEMGFDLDSDAAQGKLWLRYAKSGEERIDWVYTEFDVMVLRLGSKWSVIGTASGDALEIILDEEAQTLAIKLKGRKWLIKTTNRRISVMTSDSRSELLIRFVSDVETNKRDHYNLMTGSVFAARAVAQ